MNQKAGHDREILTCGSKIVIDFNWLGFQSFWYCVQRFDNGESMKRYMAKSILALSAIIFLLAQPCVAIDLSQFRYGDPQKHGDWTFYQFRKGNPFKLPYIMRAITTSDTTSGLFHLALDYFALARCHSALEIIEEEKEQIAETDQREVTGILKIDSQNPQEITLRLVKTKDTLFTFYILPTSIFDNVHPDSRKMTITPEKHAPIHFSLTGFLEANEEAKILCTDFSDFWEHLDKNKLKKIR